MGKYDELEGVAKREMVLFFMIDVSGSMTGSKIGTVNTTMEEILPEIVKISESNSDASIKIATLKFSKGCEWVYDKPRHVREYEWNYLDANGLTDLGTACMELNNKLSRNEYMDGVGGSYAPVIILLSDGEPTDDYRSGIAVLQNNNWFKMAVKAAIAIGKDADMSVLEEFTGNADNVVRVHTPEDLAKWIKFVTVTSSKIGSTSSTGNSTKNSLLGEKMKEEINSEPVSSPVEATSSVSNETSRTVTDPFNEPMGSNGGDTSGWLW